VTEDPEKTGAVTESPSAEPAAIDERPVEGPEKPELYVGAAFAGAFLFARILKKIAE
jgi:hypothetical protein